MIPYVICCALHGYFAASKDTDAKTTATATTTTTTTTTTTNDNNNNNNNDNDNNNNSSNNNKYCFNVCHKFLFLTLRAGTWPSVQIILSVYATTHVSTLSWWVIQA